MVPINRTQNMNDFAGTGVRLRSFRLARRFGRAFGRRGLGSGMRLSRSPFF